MLSTRQQEQQDMIVGKKGENMVHDAKDGVELILQNCSDKCFVCGRGLEVEEVTYRTGFGKKRKVTCCDCFDRQLENDSIIK